MRKLLFISALLCGIILNTLAQVKDSTSSSTGASALDQAEDVQLYETALSKIETKDYKGAIQDLSKVIETEPQNINAYYNRGRAKSLMNKYNEAIIDFDYVLEIKPESTNALRQRGAANYAIKNYKEAINDYSKIIEVNPEVTSLNWIYNYRGLAYSALQDFGKAVADYKSAFDIVFKSDDMAFKEAWPDVQQMIIIRESFKKAGALQKIEPTNLIIGKWSGKGPLFGNAILEFKNDGSFYYSYEGHKSYEIVYGADNSYIIMLDSGLVPFGHMVLKVLDKENIEIKELWSIDRSELQMTLQFGKFKEPKVLAGSKKMIDEALVLSGLDALDNYSFRGQRIDEKTGFTMREENSSRIWDWTAEQVEIRNTIDSLKAIGQLKKISDGAFKVASYLSKIDPLAGYIPVSLILLEHKHYNDAAFLYKLGMVFEGYYENVNPETFSPDFGSREYAFSHSSGYRPMMDMFLEADMENNLFVLQSVYDYLDKNDYPPQPKAKYLEEFNYQLQELQEEMNSLNETSMEEPQEEVQEEAQEVENSIASIESNIIGKWSGKWSGAYEEGGQWKDTVITLITFNEKRNCIFHVADNHIMEMLMQTDSDLYQKLLSHKDFSASYKINYDKTPIHISVELKIPDSKEQISLNYIACFLEKDVLKLGVPYLNNPTKFVPELTRILTREIKGAKNFFDYKSKYPVLANQKSGEISDKERELFWKAYILPIIKKDFPTILKNTLFPLKQYGNYIDSTSFIRESGFSGVQWDRTSTVLRDLSYKFLDQVILESGDPALMLYVLGKPNYYNYSNSPSYESFGFLFIKSNGEWKLNNFDFGSSSGELEAIENERNRLIQDGSEQIRDKLFLLETKSFVKEYIEPILSMNQNEVPKNVVFPLEGNWGNALGYTNNSSEWKKSDFSDHSRIFFNKETGKKLIEQFLNPDSESAVEAEFNPSSDYNIREARINKITVTMNEEEYESSLIFKYTKIDTNWKLTKLDWEGRSKSDINEEIQERNSELSSEEFDFFMKVNLEPIINLNKKKIIDQTHFPFSYSNNYNNKYISEKEFKSQVTNIFPQKLRDLLKNVESRYIRIEHEPRDERILNGIIKRDPPGRTVLGVYLRSPEFSAQIIFEEVGGNRVLVGLDVRE